MSASSDSGTRRRRKRQRVTLTDVAEAAEVSPSTVSLFLRQPDAVSSGRARRIADAIEALGYVPNMIAGGLAAASSRIVSVIVPSVRSVFFADMVSAMETAMAAEGFQLLLGHSGYSPLREEELVRAALSWAPSGIVLTELEHTPATRALLRESGIPVIEMWELDGEPLGVRVGLSHEEAGAAAARHLMRRGCRDIVFVGERMPEDRWAERRARGFLGQIGATSEDQERVLRHPVPGGVDAGALLLNRALQRFPEIDGLVCSDDLIALGVLFEAERRGVAVPGRLAVVGFGDFGFSASCRPPLTTIRTSCEVIGLEVARLLLAGVRGEGRAPPGEVDTSFLIVERRTT